MLSVNRTKQESFVFLMVFIIVDIPCILEDHSERWLAYLKW